MRSDSLGARRGARVPGSTGHARELESDFPAAGVELWVSDGTPGGTGRLVDILPGAEGSSPYGLMVASRKLYFAADDGEHGREPWKVFQGRARLVEDIVPGPMGSAPRISGAESGEAAVFARAGSYLFFSTESLQLWSMLTGAYCPPSGTR
jgi:ELWxxDGT repeat protein